MGDAHRAIADCHSCRQYYDIAKGLTKPIARPWLAPHEYVAPDALPVVLRALPEAVAKGLPFAFTYVDANRATTERTLIPYGWARVRGEVFFHGMCQLRNERREFRADRIVA